MMLSLYQSTAAGTERKVSHSWETTKGKPERAFTRSGFILSVYRRQHMQTLVIFITARVIESDKLGFVVQYDYS